MLPVPARSTVLSELRDKQIFTKTIRAHGMHSDQRIAGNQFPGKGDLAFKRRPVLCNLARNRVDLFLRQITAAGGLLQHPGNMRRKRQLMHLAGGGYTIRQRAGHLQCNTGIFRCDLHLRRATGRRSGVPDARNLATGNTPGPPGYWLVAPGPSPACVRHLFRWCCMPVIPGPDRMAAATETFRRLPRCIAQRRMPGRAPGAAGPGPQPEHSRQTLQNLLRHDCVGARNIPQKPPDIQTPALTARRPGDGTPSAFRPQPAFRPGLRVRPCEPHLPVALRGHQILGPAQKPGGAGAFAIKAERPRSKSAATRSSPIACAVSAPRASIRAGVRRRAAPSRPATAAARSSAAPGRVDGTLLSTRRQARASLMSLTTRL